MSSKNLQQDVGSRYIREFYGNALFRMGDFVYKFVTCTDRMAEVEALDLSKPDADWTAAAIPTSSLQSFSTFKYPTLGYREVESSAAATKGEKMVVFVTSRRSANRGLREEGLVWRGLPVIDRAMSILVSNTINQVARAERVRALFDPKFTKWKDGLPKLLEGAISGFALNENVAVGVSVNTGSDVDYDVYFKEKIVGQVSSQGQLTLYNKTIQRDSNKLFI